jgi:hypothetical protein
MQSRTLPLTDLSWATIIIHDDFRVTIQAYAQRSPQSTVLPIDRIDIPAQYLPSIIELYDAEQEERSLAPAAIEEDDQDVAS